MTIPEFYDAIGGGYQDAIGRLLDDKRIRKYVYKFEACTDYADLLAALEAGNYADAFRFSHNLKGMGLNLSLGVLAESSHVLCEALRGGPPTEDITPLVDKVKQDYALVLKNIAILKATE